MQKAEALIKDQLPQSQWPVLPRLLKTAYKAASELMKDSPILQVPTAEDNRGRFVSFAVDTGVKRAIENGSLVCDYKWEYFDKPTGRYLKLIFPYVTASISQVRHANRQPRPVSYRENARLHNQGFLDLPGLIEDTTISGLPHFFIVHGYQELTFAHLAMPSADSSVWYEWRSPNLMGIPHEVEAVGPPPEDTDYDLEEVALIKEEIEKWRRDNDDE